MIQPLDRTQLHAALPLVWKVFCDFEGIYYSEEGKQAFRNAIHAEEYLDTLTAYGAFDGEKLVGVLATRNAGSHIALFFMDGAYHRQGIGRALWNKVLEGNTAKEITVHSSLYAAKIYERLGFVRTDDVQTDGGISYIPMVYKNLLRKLQDKDDKKAYALAKEIAAKSAATEEYYPYFKDFLGLLQSKNSYVRTRGFILCCAQARWDTQGKLQSALPNMLKLLHDEKPTVVRQCLAALHEVALFRPELHNAIGAELSRMDLSNYKDSMAPLLEKDRKELQKVME